MVSLVDVPRLVRIPLRVEPLVETPLAALVVTEGGVEVGVGEGAGDEVVNVWSAP